MEGECRIQIFVQKKDFQMYRSIRHALGPYLGRTGAINGINLTDDSGDIGSYLLVIQDMSRLNNDVSDGIAQAMEDGNPEELPFYGNLINIYVKEGTGSNRVIGIDME